MDGRVSRFRSLVDRPVSITRSAIIGATSSVAYMGSATWGGGRGWMINFGRSRINYRHEAGDPLGNSAISAVVGWIARNFPDAPMALRRVYPDGRVENVNVSDESPGRALRLFERPNAWWSGPLMMSAAMIDYQVRGDAYIVKVRNDAGFVEELWWIPYDMMEPKWEGRKFISYYEQVLDGGDFRRWDPLDVIHLRNGIDPDNPRKGRSPVWSLLREIFTDNEASAFTAQLLRNLGVPGVIISPANTAGPLRGKPEVIKNEFMEKFGGDRRGEPMVLTGATDVKVLSFTPQQMDLRSLRKIPEERISAVYGVAAIVAGLGAGLDRSTFSNFGEARVAAYTEGVIPTQRVWSAEFENQLIAVDFPDLDHLDDGSILDLWFDWTKAASMQYLMAQIWDRHMQAATKGLLTRAEFKRAVGLTVRPEDEVYLIANNITVLSAGSTPPAGGQLQLSAPAERPRLPAPPSAMLDAGTIETSRNGHDEKLSELLR